MTDDNKSEGQYDFIGGIVECPDGNYKITSGDKYIQEIKSQSYAEGRKAERERCAIIAKLNCTVEEIVDMIMGGQDGE